jgi:hypothetical protein
MPAVSFKYQLHHRRWMPIIPIELRTSRASAQAEAYVDSGAFWSLFTMDVARNLKLNLRDGKQRLMRVGDGGLIKVSLFKLIVEVAGRSFPAEVGFSEDLRIGFNLIGRKGVFEHFDEVSFRERHRELDFRWR